MKYTTYIDMPSLVGLGFYVFLAPTCDTTSGTLIDRTAFNCFLIIDFETFEFVIACWTNPINDSLNASFVLQVSLLLW